MGEILTLVAVLWIGLSIGSFVNVLILRSMIGKNLSGRSVCTHCGMQLTWRDLVPVLSFVMLEGRCRACGKPISIQYPLVELAVGILAWAVFVPFPQPAAIPVAVLTFGIGVLGIVLFVIDVRTMMLPDVYIVALTVLVALRVAVESNQHPASVVWGVGIGAGFLLLLWIGTRGRGIGMGDVKLLVPFGMLFGAAGTLTLLFFSFCAGGLVGIYLLATHKATPKTPIPFGPYVIGAALILLLWPQVMNVFFRWTGFG